MKDILQASPQQLTQAWSVFWLSLREERGFGMHKMREDGGQKDKGKRFVSIGKRSMMKNTARGHAINPSTSHAPSMV